MIDPSDWEIDDELDEIEMTVDPTRKAEEYERRASAAEPTSLRHTELLLGAGEHHERVGDFTQALRCYQLAESNAVLTDPSVSAHLISLALARGDHEDADARAIALRREGRERDLGSDWAFVGEAFEEAGRLRDAARWFTLANVDVDPDDVEELDASALAGRHRVRRALELPVDRYDVSAEAFREHYRRRAALD